MKQYPIFIVLAVWALFTGCQHQEMDFITGSDGLIARIEPMTSTRTAYDDDDAVGEFNWSTGDQIAIHTTAPAYQTGNVDPATGAVTYVNRFSEPRDAYAIFPAADKDESNYGSGSTSLKVILPTSYDIHSDFSSDYSPMPMVAVNDQDDSYLNFYHVGGMLRIDCAEVPAGIRTISVSLDKGITGAFAVENPDTDHPTIRAAAAGSSNTTVSFIVADASGLPAETDGIILNIPVPVGVYNSVGINYYDKDGALVVSVGNDVTLNVNRAHALKLYTSAHFYRYTFTVSQPSELATGGGVSNEGFLTSHMVTFFGDREPVSWTLTGYFSDQACKNAVSKPSWVSSVTPSGYGSMTYDPITVKYLPSNYTLTRPGISGEDAANNAIAAKGVAGSASNYQNLSNPANMSSDNIVESANCYIVNAQGYYRIPLVMGNGVKNGAVNSNAATYQGRTGANVIQFVDYKGNVVQNPYLHKSSSTAGVPTTADVIWEDVDGLIEAPGYDLPDGCIVKSGDVYWLLFHVTRPEQGNAVIAVHDADETVMWTYHIWVTDYVPKNYPGYSSSTKKDMVVDPSYNGHTSSNRYNMMPFNLGWVVSGGTYVWDYPKDEVYVQFTQAGSGNKVALHLLRSHQVVTRRLGPHCPFYQWGRRDAFWTGYGVNNVETTWFGKYPGNSGYEILEPSLSTGIKHPQFVYGRDGYAFWGSDSYSANLWNAGRTDGSDMFVVTKTIYDPTPAGYHMAPGEAYRGFTKTADDVYGDASMTPEERAANWALVNGTLQTETVGGITFKYYNLNTNTSSGYMRFYMHGSRNWGAGPGQPTGFIDYEGRNAALWTADPLYSSINAGITTENRFKYAMYMDWSHVSDTQWYVWPNRPFARNYAFSVRPVEE